jgi:N-acyl-L-homoserine lactone synthetase
MYIAGKKNLNRSDAYSIHFIAKIKNDVVGTARLILNNSFGFPIEKSCSLDISIRGIKKRQTAEISRLAVSKEIVKSSGYNRRGIVLGLFREMYRESKNLGIKYFYAAMGKGLQRLLIKCGIKFLQVGSVVDYHGPRAPFVTRMKNIEEGVFLKDSNLVRFFTTSKNSDYALPQVSYNAG